jgi:acyl-[acyl-carrier-protein]-phospholipid O-acyltransferase/long-chain-fatty-acid--[acyl-carrier-protein] ligase
VLVAGRADAERAAFHAWAKGAGVPELMVPRAVLVVASVPVLGSGKIDVVATEQLAKDMRPML